MQDEPLSDVLQKIQAQVKGLTLWLNPEGRASDRKVSYRVEKRPLRSVLDQLFERHGLGYVVVSEPGNPHDGWVEVRAGHERGDPEGGRPLADLETTVRIHGRDTKTWKGRILSLPEQEASRIPAALTNKAGGPVAAKATQPTPKAGSQEEGLVPQTQHYMVYVEILNPDDAIIPGNMAQVKVRCRSETCLHWLWRTLHDTFDVALW